MIGEEAVFTKDCDLKLQWSPQTRKSTDIKDVCMILVCYYYHHM